MVAAVIPPGLLLPHRCFLAPQRRRGEDILKRFIGAALLGAEGHALLPCAATRGPPTTSRCSRFTACQSHEIRTCQTYSFVPAVRCCDADVSSLQGNHFSLCLCSCSNKPTFASCSLCARQLVSLPVFVQPGLTACSSAGRNSASACTRHLLNPDILSLSCLGRAVKVPREQPPRNHPAPGNRSEWAPRCIIRLV